MTVYALHRTSVDTALVAGKIKAWQKYGTMQLLVLSNITNIKIFKKINYRFRVIFGIFILMGLSWIFQIVSYALGLSEYHNFLREESGV